MTDYHLMVDKQYGDDGLIAVPDSSYISELEEAYEQAGTLHNLEKDDFRHHRHWGHSYLPIEVTEEVVSPSQSVEDEVKQGLESMCRSDEANLDGNLARDEDIVSYILDREFLEGKIHILRVNGTPMGEREQRSTAYFFKDEYDFAVDGSTLRINDEEVDIKNAQALLLNQEDGVYEHFEAGEVSIPRQFLKPYPSRERMRRTHLNGPWMVLEDNPDPEMFRQKASEL